MAETLTKEKTPPVKEVTVEVVKTTPTKGGKTPPPKEIPFNPTLPDYIGIDDITPSSGVSVEVLTQIVERSFATARLGDSVGIGYGRFTVPAKIVRAMEYNNKLLLVCVWLGCEVDAVEAVYSDVDEVSPIASYTGTASQTANATVAAAFGQADDLPGVCYSVISLNVGASLNLRAVIRGKKVYDPRTDTTAYSTNPALCLADFIETYTDYSTDLAVAGNIADAADYCDEEIADGVKRWEIGLLMEARQSPERWIGVLAEYANVYLFLDNGTIKLVPDEPAAVAETFDEGDVVSGSLKLTKLGQRDVPTQVTVDYRLPVADSAQWTDSSESTPDPTSGDPLRITRLSMPGYAKATHAYRKAVQTLNRATLEDLEVEFETFDRGITLTKGDLFTLTHEIGLSSSTFRALDVSTKRAGRWKIKGREYSESTYSSDLVDDPDAPDTNLPDPRNVPAVTSISVEVLTPQFQTGLYFSSIRATWADVDYLYGHQFEVVVRESGSVVGSFTTAEPSAVWGPLQENKSYTFSVAVIGSGGNRSETMDSPTTTVSGKDFPPTDVPNFVAFGIGGELRSRWGESSDNQAIWRYELRYGASGVTWDNATFLTRTDSFSFNTKELPAGTYDILIKAIDNAGNYSTNASRAAGVELDQSADIYLLDSADADTDEVSTTGFTELPNGKFVTDSGETFNSLFPNAMNTYTNPLLSYQTPASSIYYSLELDPGVGEIGGIWQATPDVEVLSGVPTSEVETYNGSTWDSHGTLSVAESAYKSRFKLSGSAVVMITPPTPLRVDVQIHEETGAEQTIGGGTATADNGAGTQLTDSAATFQTDGVAIGDKVRNLTDGSEALVTGISSENVITHGALSGGSSNDWTDGDVYAIGVKITTSAAYSALKGITLTPNGVSAPTDFDFDDLALGDPTTFFVYGTDFSNEEVSEPFNWRVQGV